MLELKLMSGNQSGNRPLVMGIVNVTPDSFSDGGKYLSPEKAIEHSLKLVEEGADIIDIGGESTRPGAIAITDTEEIDRVQPVLEGLAGRLTIPISIDTRKTKVAQMACEYGASMINDISGLRGEPKMAEVAARYKIYLALMHMRGTPETMQIGIQYADLIGEITEFLADAAQKAIEAGVSRDKIIIDPGIGFGKTVEHNFILIKKLDLLAKLGYPILIGVSRKSFIGKSLDLPVDERLEGSLAAAIYAALKGAAIIRVHDVLSTVRALRIVELIEKADQ
jgi:dihydropteroate synthase